MSVTLQIKDNGQTVDVAWHADMDVQNLLETAYNQVRASGGNFSFALQYYGYSGTTYLGYFVTMIDGIYDNPNNPNDYWLYYINGQVAPVGIDSYFVKDGDMISFDYVPATVIPTSLQHTAKNSMLALQ